MLPQINMKFEDVRLTRVNIIGVCFGKMITAKIENLDFAQPGAGGITEYDAGNYFAYNIALLGSYNYFHTSYYKNIPIYITRDRVILFYVLSMWTSIRLTVVRLFIIYSMTTYTNA